MYKVSSDSSSDVVLAWAGYPRAKLYAKSETRDLARLIDAGVATLKAEETAYVSARETMNASLALRDLANDTADETVLGVGYLLKRLERSPSRWTKQIFPDGVSEVIYGPVRGQPSDMEQLAGRLANADDPELRGSASIVLETGIALRDRNDAYDASRDQVAVAYSNVLDARVELIRAVERVYGQLLSRYGKKAAERYFPKRSRKTKKKAAAAG